jgi:hypothetical protein
MLCLSFVCLFSLLLHQADSFVPCPSIISSRYAKKQFPSSISFIPLRLPSQIKTALFESNSNDENNGISGFLNKAKDSAKSAFTKIFHTNQGSANSESQSEPGSGDKDETMEEYIARLQKLRDEELSKKKEDPKIQDEVDSDNESKTTTKKRKSRISKAKKSTDEETDESISMDRIRLPGAPTADENQSSRRRRGMMSEDGDIMDISSLFDELFGGGLGSMGASGGRMGRSSGRRDSDDIEDIFGGGLGGGLLGGGGLFGGLASLLGGGGGMVGGSNTPEAQKEVEKILLTEKDIVSSLGNKLKSGPVRSQSIAISAMGGGKQSSRATLGYVIQGVNKQVNVNVRVIAETNGETGKVTIHRIALDLPNGKEKDIRLTGPNVNNNYYKVMNAKAKTAEAGDESTDGGDIFNVKFTAPPSDKKNTSKGNNRENDDSDEEEYYDDEEEE